MPVIYPASINTDLLKLAAVNSLREQFRVEHNRQGEIALADWPATRGKWRTYTRLYRRAAAPLGAEYVRLREAIRRAVYSDAEWEKRSPLQPDEAIALFGDRLKLTLTAAMIDTLDGLKRVRLRDLEGPITDPYEDWTTYTETDPNNVLTVAANQITYTGIMRASACTVYADKGVGHFGATFQHLIDASMDTGTGIGDVFCHVWSVANATLPNYSTDPLITVFYSCRADSSSYIIYLMVDDGATDQTDFVSGQAWTTIRYLTVDKNATDTDCFVYSNAARTSLVDTLTVANGSTSYRYIHSAFARGGSSVNTASGYVYNLDLQEVVVGQPYALRVQGVAGMRTWGGP